MDNIRAENTSNSNSLSWHGKLKLTYKKKDNITQLSNFYSQSPFKIQSPF